MAADAKRDLRVAIVGAGIAGLALAMGLYKKGVPFTIYEAETEYSTVGAGIGFGPNGDSALDMLEERFGTEFAKVCIGNRPADAQDVYFEGLLLEEGLGLKEPWYGCSTWGHPNYTRRAVRDAIESLGVLESDADMKQAHRNAVLQIMTSFIPIEKVQFSKRLTEIDQQRDKVILRFADGDTASASLVVGADGIKSMVRAHVLQPQYPSEVEPVYADSYCYRGVIPIAEAKEILGDLTDVAKIYVGHKRCCVTYLISGGEELNFLLCAIDDKSWEMKNTVTQRVTHEAMMADFEGPGVDERFRRLLSKAMPIKWGFFHHRSTSTYYHDRVVLLGDSAHASLPFQAAGAGQGLEDALVLSNLLAKIYQTATEVRGEEGGKGFDLQAHIHAGFMAYGSIRRPRAQKQLERVYEMSQMIHLCHPETGDDMNKVISKLQGWFDWIWFHDLEVDVQAALRGMDEGLTR